MRTLALIMLSLVLPAVAADAPTPSILQADEAEVLRAQVELLNRDLAQLRATQAQMKILIARGEAWSCAPPAADDKMPLP